jgi:chitin synthase
MQNEQNVCSEDKGVQPPFKINTSYTISPSTSFLNESATPLSPNGPSTIYIHSPYYPSNIEEVPTNVVFNENIMNINAESLEDSSDEDEALDTDDEDNGKDADREYRRILKNSGETTITPERKKWVIVSNLFTFYIPDCILNKNLEVRQAWREKTTIVIMFFLLSCLLIFLVAFLPKLLCVTETVYSWENIYKTDRALMVVNGKVLDVGDYIHLHPGPMKKFTKSLGQDVSQMFLKPNPLIYKPKLDHFVIYPQLLSLFLDYQKNDTGKYCSNNFCHLDSTLITNSSLVIGDLSLNYPLLNAQKDQNWFILYNKVYNVSDYYTYGHPVYPPKFDYITQPKQMAYYLDTLLNSTIMNRLKQDATPLFEENYPYQGDRNRIIGFLDMFYYAGKIDLSFNATCAALDTIYLLAICVISGVLIVKFLASLYIMYKQYPKCDFKHLIINIPCYTEDKQSLEKTIHSIYDSEYPDDKKLMFIVADGVLNIFGRSLNENQVEYQYDALGDDEKSLNYAKVYSGWHKNNERNLPYIVVVKTGLKTEAHESKRGNRGKRDSQLILFNFLSKLHYKTELNELERKLKADFKKNFTINPLQNEFMLSVDADTYVHKDAIKHMVYRMKDPKIIALCGETLVSNKLDSWVTAIQVYEYYINHNLNKAFESLFSSVTCLPGCFSMYRIRSSGHRKKPILIDEDILEEYSDNNVNTLHKKNLLHLGEDRFFTTLLTKHFPKGKIKFITEARCETTVPNTWSVLLSQRRRWINSTLHNLFELLFVDRMCGVCCFSMKFVIFLDIITTMFLPASCLYLLYLIYEFAFQAVPVPLEFIIVISVLSAVQVLIFVVKRDFIFIIWLIIYSVAVPIWTIILPVYAFFHMDDFSWGNTRKLDVTKKVVNNTPQVSKIGTPKNFELQEQLKVEDGILREEQVENSVQMEDNVIIEEMECKEPIVE